VLRGLDALPLPDTDGRGGATTRGGGEKQQSERKSKPWLTHLQTMVVDRASTTVEVSADTSVGSSSKEQYAPSKSSTPTNSSADHDPTPPFLGHRLNQQFRQLLKSMLHPQAPHRPSAIALLAHPSGLLKSAIEKELAQERLMSSHLSRQLLETRQKGRLQGAGDPARSISDLHGTGARPRTTSSTNDNGRRSWKRDRSGHELHRSLTM
jgi:hypothetical protein